MTTAILIVAKSTVKQVSGDNGKIALRHVEEEIDIDSEKLSHLLTMVLVVLLSLM